MNTSLNEALRSKVRENYGNIVRGAGAQAPAGQTTACCGSGPEPDPASTGCGCGTGNISAVQIAALIGYSQAEQDSVPEGANLGLGVGTRRPLLRCSRAKQWWIWVPAAASTASWPRDRLVGTVR